MEEKYMVPPDFKYSQKIWKNFTVKEFVYLLIMCYPAILILKTEIPFMAKLVFGAPFVGLGFIVGRYRRYGLGLDIVACNWLSFQCSPKSFRQFESGGKKLPKTGALVPMREIHEDILVLSGGVCVKIIKCGSVNFSLLSEQEKRVTERSFKELCHSLSGGFPLQFFIRSRSISSDDLVGMLDASSRKGGNRRAKDRYEEFLRELAKGGRIHQKEFYVVIPYNRFSVKGRRMNPSDYYRVARSLFGRKEKEEPDLRDVGEQLKMREELVVKGLRRCGLEAETLCKEDMLQFLYEVFNPDLEGDPSKRDDIRPLIRDEADMARMVELIAPTAVDIGPDYLRIGNLYVRILAVMDWPMSLWAGWVQFINDISDDIDVSIHVSPRDMSADMRYLSAQIKKMHGSTMADKLGGMANDHLTQVQMEKAEKLIRKFASGEEKLFDFVCSIAVRASSLGELNDKTETTKSKMAAREITVDAASSLMKDAFLTFVPMGMRRLPFSRRFTSSLMGASFPLTSYDMSGGGGILYGIGDDASSLVMLDRFGHANHNMAIVGQSGQGKSFFAKALLLRELARGVQAVVLDPEMEYKNMCEALGGQHIVFAPQSDSAINPLDRDFRLRDKSLTSTDSLVRENMLFLKLIMEDAKQEYSPLKAEELLYQVYRNYERPLLADLRNTAAKFGYTDVEKSLYSWTEGTLKGLFDRDTNVDLDADLIVFDLSRLKREHRGLAIQVIESWYWKRIRDDRVRRIFQVDEASWLLRDYDCAEAFEQLARRGRKYGVGFTVIDQQLDQLMSNEKSRAIVANCAIKALFQMDKGIVDNYVAKAVSLTEREQELMMSLLRGECIIHAGAQRAKIKVEASADEMALFSTSIGEAG
jgi:hypothetical protein